MISLKRNHGREIDWHRSKLSHNDLRGMASQPSKTMTLRTSSRAPMLKEIR